MDRRPILSFFGRSSNIGRSLTAEANKRQYWLTDHPLFVIFYAKITLIMGAAPKLPLTRGGRCDLTFTPFRMVNLLPVTFLIFQIG